MTTAMGATASTGALRGDDRVELDRADGPVSVRIVSFARLREGGFMVYTVEIGIGHHVRYRIRRRFRQFAGIRPAVARALARIGIAEAPFPAKTWFTDQSVERARARSEALQRWLHVALTSPGALAAMEPSVRTFLELSTISLAPVLGYKVRLRPHISFRLVAHSSAARLCDYCVLVCGRARRAGCASDR